MFVNLKNLVFNILRQMLKDYYVYFVKACISEQT